MLSASELEDFEATIVKAGFEVRDFRPVQVDNPAPTLEVHAVTGTVTVHRRLRAIAIAYPTGHGSTWLADFEADLNAGKFGHR